MVPLTWILFAFEGGSRGFETDSSDEGIEIVDDALIEAIELRSPLGFELGVCSDGAEKACGERRIDAFEQLQGTSKNSCSD